MIRTEQLLYKINLKLNKVATESHQAIPVEDQIMALNEAQMRLIKKKVNLNNLYKIGLDGFKVRYEDLQKLIVPYKSLTATLTNEPISSYSVQTPKDYYLPVDIIAKATKGKCKDHKIFIKRIVKHGDVTTWLNNPHYEPSFAYQETFAAVSEDKIICYTNDDFTIETINLSYLRYPKKIDFEGYIGLDNIPTVTQDCELPEYLEDELLELTIMELGINTNNPAGQTALTKSLNSE